MFTINSNSLDGTITISDKFNISASASAPDATPYLNEIDSEYILSFNDLEGVSKFTKFIYDTLGMTDTRYLVQYYRLSRDGERWTDWYDLKKNIDNFPVIDPKDKLNIDIKWVRKGTNRIGSIRILEYSLEGTIETTTIIDDGSTAVIAAGETQIIKPPYIFKVFRIDDIEIISSTGVPDGSLKYRYSQDNARTWSNWEVLTKENIKTKRFTPVRFFQVEYSIENTSGSQIRVQDINLIGNFQNVTLDSQKTNLYGIRECCQSNLNGAYDANGNFIPNTNLNSSSSSSGSAGGGNCPSPATYKPMTADQQALLYNPYNQNTAVNLLNQLSNDAQLLFGHKVIYFATDPDKNGYDYSLHEYSLYNIVCQGDLRISVENNNFPDSQVVMNQFDLNLFSTMEVHVTKEQFKQIFGVQRRPSKEDFLYFCNLNRMYIVDHAQQFRSFNNSAVYYKLILKKYNQKANIQSGTTEIQNKMDMLTQNSTIDSLFGIENSQDKASIANKDQFKPLTKDPIRLKYLATIDKELIENSSTVISKSHYDLSSVDYETPGVEYFNLDPLLQVSDNIGFTVWFSINNYILDEYYNMFDYYDNQNSLGWSVNLTNDKIIVMLNENQYEFDFGTGDVIELEEETWYCYVLNVDQRNRTMSQYIYKRNIEFEEDAARLTSTVLKKVHSNEQTIEPVSYQLEGIDPVILGSDMKLTNVRLFLDVIPEDTHNKILNQYVMREDSKYLVFADNANTRLYLPNFPLFE
jgi:hypothetical protein